MEDNTEEEYKLTTQQIIQGKMLRLSFPIIYCFDWIAHRLGYAPSREHRAWWCEYAEDGLTEIANISHNNDGCFWCRRYYRDQDD